MLEPVWIEAGYQVIRPRCVLFDHLPKCGGSSLRAWLSMQYPGRKIFIMDGNNPRASVREFLSLPEKVRQRYSLIQGHCANEIMHMVPADWLKITMLREPVDRMVSHYYYVRRQPGHYPHSQVAGSGMGLKEYAASGLSEELRNWYTAHFAELTLQEAEARPEESVERALDALSTKYDVVGFLEDYDSFVQEVHRRANFWRRPAGKRVNVTRDRPSVDRVDAEALEAIRTANRLDIELYRKLKARASAG